MEAEVPAQFMLILGKPGGGKGTIANKILKDFPTFKHFSTGDMLRQHVRDQTPIGKEAKGHMDTGGLVPDSLIIRLVLDEAEKEFDSGNSLLLDGFPRTMEQAKALGNSVQVDLVVDLDVPNGTIVERIADRWIHPASCRVYNLSYNPPRVPGKDDITGEDLFQRDDDKPETVTKRLEAYDKVTAPLVQYYNEQGVLKTFSGTESDKIYPKVNDWLHERLQSKP
jgi:nucleoside-triphosphate--adenylate kinase